MFSRSRLLYSVLMDDKQMKTLIEIQKPIQNPPILLNLISENPNNLLITREEEVLDSLELMKEPSENKTLVSDYKNLKLETSENLTCCECGKLFNSMKALCGHMRSHPERQYRGIKPSYSVFKNKKQPKIGFKNQQQIIPPALRVSKPDLLICMPKPISRGTGKTKCKSIASRSMSLDKRESNEACFDEAEEAACTLMMISNGNTIHIVERTGVKRSRITVDGGHGVALLEDNVLVLGTSEVPNKGKMKLKKRRVEKANEKKSRDGLDPEFVRKTGSELETSNGLEKLCELSAVTSYKPSAPVSPSDIFHCTNCGRSFTSYQALGGHKSSCKQGNFKADVAGITLVKELVINSIHKCKICDKVFPTGQALGGHQTRHRIGPELEATAPVLLPKETSKESPPPLVEVEELRCRIGPELECAPVSSPKVISKESPSSVLEVEEINRKVVWLDLNEPPLVDNELP